MVLAKAIAVPRLLSLSQAFHFQMVISKFGSITFFSIVAPGSMLNRIRMGRERQLNTVRLLTVVLSGGIPWKNFG